MNIYGFAIIRNGVKFDFPFIESLLSMVPITKKIFIAVGAGEDDTEEKLRSHPVLASHLEIINTTWDLSFREGGLIFSQQTNIALEKIREYCKEINDTSAWALYLQSDELIHENEYETIKFDLQKAEEEHCDALRFRYVHFWQSHNKMAINKKWYPQEIRAVKVNSPVMNYGDAQTFSGQTKIFESDTHIYHYGHVREEKAYNDKKEHQISLHFNDKKLKKYRRRWIRADRNTEVANFFGNHPEVMRERIKRLGGVFSKDQVEVVYIVGNQNDYSDKFKKAILAKKVIWCSTLFQVPFKVWREAVVLGATPLSFIFSPSAVPHQMRSKIARRWANDFYLLMKLSEKEIGVNL